MYYERMRTPEAPYKLWIGSMQMFIEHRHADFEFAYCYEGGFRIIADNKEYNIKKGDFVIIPPMVAHASANEPCENTRAVCGIFGASFLGKGVSELRRLCTKVILLSLDEDVGQCSKMRKLLEEMNYCLRNPSPSSELMNTGNLYKLAACIVDEMSLAGNSSAKLSKDVSKLYNVDKALELIYSSYMRDLTVEEAADVSGYSRSNFCKIFKSAVGESFHKALNNYRISSSCGLLISTDMQISDIAQEVGFTEAKTFCRVFKDKMGLTPGEYKKMHIK